MTGWRRRWRRGRPPEPGRARRRSVALGEGGGRGLVVSPPAAAFTAAPSLAVGGPQHDRRDVRRAPGRRRRARAAEEGDLPPQRGHVAAERRDGLTRGLALPRARKRRRRAAR